jgi:exodeoxyribonuclease VII small subunit
MSRRINIMQEFNFEESMKRLKDIVSKLEDDTLPLDEGLELYREGCELAKKLKIYIENAKQKVEVFSEELTLDLKLDGTEDEE